MGNGVKGFWATCLFTILGPATGGLVMVSLSRIYARKLYAFSSVDMGVFLFSYLVGGVSAFATGILVGAITARGENVSYRLAALAGFGAQFLFSTLLGLMGWFGGKVNLNGSFVLSTIGYGLIGMTAAVICLWLCRRMGLLAGSRPLP